MTDTFRGRGFGTDIIVGISAPIQRDGRLVGVIEGSLNLEQLALVLDSASSRRGLDIVLLDRSNRVVAARGSAPLQTGEPFVRPHPSITDADLPSLRVSSLKDESRLAAVATLQPFGWRVEVAQPVASLAPAFEAQFRTVVRDMGVALLVVFTLSIALAGIMARPLGQFAQALGDDSGGGARLLRSVRGAPREIRRFALVLVRAQRRQRRSLHRQQQLVAEKDQLNQELHQFNVELDQIVEARTRVIAERERQLRSSETRWRTMAEIAPDAVVVIDEDNVIQFVNSRLVSLAGHGREEMLGRQLDEVMVPDRLRHHHRHGLQRYLRTNTPRIDWRATETFIQRKDGSELPVEIAFGEYVLEGRRYFAGYLRDITVRKQHEAEVVRARDLAEAANHSKDAFLATMSHEIRTPLHGLIGTLDLMAREDLDERLANRLNIARNSARALLQIANDVLDLSGIEAGRVRIETVAFDLRDVVTAVSTSFEPGALEKGLRLEHEIDADVPGWVEGDPLRVRQILGNLVNNALKFTAKGRILLHVHRAAGDEIVFDVVDTGIGVPEDKRDHIFGRFAQAEDERTRRFGGAGLGLAISRLLARAMGGDLTLPQTGSVGSTFRLVLPLRASSVEAPLEATGSLRKLQQLVLDPARPPRVLVIDDNPANRYVVEAYLQELGAVAVLADAADAGIAELLRDRFDLVLMDVQMPGKDGYQATREIRAELGLTALPIVAMTANANIGERARCEAAGMDDLLVKPFDAARLVDVLNRNIAVAREARPTAAAMSRPAVTAGAAEPIIESSSPDSVVQRFADKPSTLRKLYSALQESITMHLEAIRVARAAESPQIAATLHGLKG
ncbi:MAG: ATP-binding protein, partial [Steroidobacteraceae bacterium]